MKREESEASCQIPCLEQLAVGSAPAPPMSLARRVKLAIRRHLDPGRERAFKNYTNNLMNQLARWMGRSSMPAALPGTSSTTLLQSGDLVRVRPLEEIEATLNHWRQLKGCTFMPEMVRFCGTTQRVHKRMERFVDERDLRVKKSRGIVLLESVMCEGTESFGSCDRSCLFFWREEWLERVESGERAI